jgi:hypothetical protein
VNEDDALWLMDGRENNAMVKGGWWGKEGNGEMWLVGKGRQW